MLRASSTGALLAAILIAAAPTPALAQAPAPKAPAKLSRPMQKALADHRRNVGRGLRGGPDDYYVVVLGEVTDRPREPNILDLLHVTTAATALMWDALFTPVVLLSGNGEELLMSHRVPPLQNTIERSYQQEVRVVHTKAAAIQVVFDYTTALVNAPPAPPVQKYRAWAFARVARTEAAAEEAKAAVEAKLAALAAKPAGFFDALFKGEARAEPKEEEKKKAPPADREGAAERARKLLEEAQRHPESLEKLREQLQRDLFGAPS